ncbi:MAG: DUF433 domain-containing protein [Lacipirellulaceae bacterium]
MSSVVHIDPEILGGTPVFKGTRVPVVSLFDHLRGDYTVNEFLEQFPSVTPEQADALLAEAQAKVLAGISAPPAR